MRRLLARRLTKRTLAAVAGLGLVALAAWWIDRTLHGPRAVEAGDDAVASRLLGGFDAWDAATCAERRAAAVWVGSTTDGFAFDRLDRFGFDEYRHEIAVFTHAATDLEFSLILGGTFQMGSPQSEADRDADETQHAVTIKAPFLLCRTETTQAAWERVMTTNPSTGGQARINRSRRCRGTMRRSSARRWSFVSRAKRNGSGRAVRGRRPRTGPGTRRRTSHGSDGTARTRRP